ncbi:EAL domain-containing protein [bacterium]|nr:EAL domain-containing protein [bacterium]
MTLIETSIHEQIILHESICTFFHPIVSIKNRSIMGFEALSRGYNPFSYEYIYPDILFNCDKPMDALQIDRLCRKKSIEKFASTDWKDTEMFLSINFDSSLLDDRLTSRGKFLEIVEIFHMNPRQIVIEILESKVKNLTELQTFVEFYREAGFMIALDDVGAGHSNLNRFTFIKPDIIKLDRGLISNIQNEYYKQEVVKAIINLSHTIGAVAVAEGVETEEEVICSMELGADLFQGFYFTQPTEITSTLFTHTQNKIQKVSSGFRTRQIHSFHHRQKKRAAFEEMVRPYVESLRNKTEPDFNDCLRSIVLSDPSIECVYILDSFGVQTTLTVCQPTAGLHAHKFLFRPAVPGSDQSLKEYFLLIDAGLTLYVSEPYVSLASGNLCITISTSFKNTENDTFVFCMDIHPDAISCH